jgi:primosomal protein N'
MIQTFMPDHSSISLAANHDCLKFAELEPTLVRSISIRRISALPA